MAVSPQQAARIVQEESAKFLEDGFGGVDLSSFPSLQTLLPEQESHDDRFARSYYDSGFARSAAALKEFVSNPDREALDILARETGDADLVRKISDARAREVAIEFMRQNPTYYRSDENYDLIVRTLACNAFNREFDDDEIEDAEERLIEAGLWTVANLTASFRALDARGLLRHAPGTLQNLTEHQLRLVSLKAASGQIEDALATYVRFRLGSPDFADIELAIDGLLPDADEVTTARATAEMFAADPKYRQAMAEAVMYVFEQTELSYAPTPERKEFLSRYVGNRFPTVALLRAAWKECQLAERDATRSALLHQVNSSDDAPERPEDLDALDDESINNLFRRTLRHYAKSAAKAPGLYAQ